MHLLRVFAQFLIRSLVSGTHVRQVLFRHPWKILQLKMVEIDRTEDKNDGCLKVTENQTNHAVATGINHDITVMQYHLL